MEMNWVLGLGLVATAIVAALLGIVVLAALQGRTTQMRSGIFTDEASGTVFLFDG